MRPASARCHCTRKDDDVAIDPERVAVASRMQNFRSDEVHLLYRTRSMDQSFQATNAITSGGMARPDAAAAVLEFLDRIGDEQMCDATVG